MIYFSHWPAHYYHFNFQYILWLDWSSRKFTHLQPLWLIHLFFIFRLDNIQLQEHAHLSFLQSHCTCYKLFSSKSSTIFDQANPKPQGQMYIWISNICMLGEILLVILRSNGTEANLNYWISTLLDLWELVGFYNICY